MEGSINFDGSLVGNINRGRGGGGDTVVITPVVTSGTKIADVSVNGVEKDLYCPTPPTPPVVEITPVVTSGTKIADVSVGGVEKDLYAPNPTQISVNQVQQSGTKIASISVNGASTDLYAPEGGGGRGETYSTTEWNTGDVWIDNRHIFGRVIDLGVDTEVTSSWTAMNVLVPEISFFLNAWGIREGNGMSISLNAWNQYDNNYSLAVQAREWGMVRYIIIKYVKNS